MIDNVEKRTTCICGSTQFGKLFTYNAPPEGEIRFAFTSADSYYREILCCSYCSHMVSVHHMDAKDLYQGDYVSSNYSNVEGMINTFNRIINLPPEKSDNTGRVARVTRFAMDHFGESADDKPSILDVGSGLCVFLHLIKRAGWNCTALDPDTRATEHARNHVGVKAIEGDFIAVESIGMYDVISFNKVLEHVEDPVLMLNKAMAFLNRGGFVYLELPDGEIAQSEGSGREEFFIDHLHIFGAASLAVMVERAGFKLLLLERLKEPSSKYTLRAFLCKNCVYDIKEAL